MSEKNRTKRRASSRASYPCPDCGKLLHGFKGVEAHRKAQHQPTTQTTEVRP